MKRRMMIPAILLTLAAGFSACQKETSSSTTGDSTLGIRLQAQNKSYTLPVNTGGIKSASAFSASVKWDTALMIVSRIKFEADLKKTNSHHDSIEIEYTWNGPQLVNLLDTSVTLGNFTLLPGYYDEIELKVAGNKKDAGDKPVFYLYGIYTNAANTSLPIIFAADENVEFKTEKDSVEVIADNSIFNSTILLYLDQLLVDIDPAALDNATLTNGVIVISENKNHELYNIIMRNLGKDHHCEHGHGHGHGH
jgi:hypothetical protein